MSVVDCLAKVKDYVKESGLDGTIKKARLEYFASRLDQVQAGTMSRAEFAAKANELFDQDIARENSQRQALNAQQLLLRRDIVSKILDNTKRFQADFDAGKKIPLLDTRVGMATEAMRAWIEGGEPRPGQGTNMSPELMRVNTRTDLLNIKAEALRDAEAVHPGLTDVFNSGKIDRGMLLALDAMDKKTTLEGRSELEIAGAKVLKATRDEILRQKMSANPQMESAQNFLWKQMHDPDRIEAMGKQSFIGLIMQHAGEKSFPELSALDKSVKFGEMYDKIVSRRWGTLQDDADGMRVRRGSQNIAGRMSASRQITFNDAASFADYTAQAGPKTISEGLHKVIGNSSNDIAMLQKAGSDPQAMYESVKSDVEKRLDGADREQFKKDSAKLDKLWRIAQGSQNAPAYGIIGRGAQGRMAWKAICATGGSVFRAPQDAAFGAGLMKSLDGSNIVGNVWELAKTFGHSMVDSKFREQRLNDLNIVSRAYQQEILRDIGGAVTAKPGSMTKLVDLSGTLNLHTRAVDSWGAAIGTLLSKRLGDFADTAHADLPKTFRDGLARNNIDGPKWDLYRKFGTEQMQGNTHMTPDALREMPNEAAENYLRSQGLFKGSGDVPQRMLDQFKDHAFMELGTMINEHAQLTSARPDVRQRSFMWGDTTINEGWGALRRMVTQFKAASITQATTYRRMYYSGETPRGGLSALAQVGAFSATAFVLGDAAKQLAQGKTPENPLSAEYVLKTLIGSGLTSMSLDSLQSAMDEHTVKDRAGAIALSTLGAVPGDLLHAGMTAFQAAQEYAAKGHVSRDTRKAAAKDLLAQVPFQNLPIVKSLFDYYVANRLKDMAGPGYLGNIERSTNARGQDYLVGRPTGPNYLSGKVGQALGTGK